MQYISPPREEPEPEPIEQPIEYDDDIDGAPFSDEKDDEDLDGVPLDGAALLKGALMRGLPESISLQKDTPKRNCSQDVSPDMD